MLETGEINVILELINRAPIKGQEAMTVAIIQQKLNKMLPKEETVEETPVSQAKEDTKTK